MNSREFTDEQLMAYVDGELDEQTCHRIEAALDDHDLAARINTFASTRELSFNAYQHILNQPVPPRLLAATYTNYDSKVVPLAPKRRSWFDRPIAVSAANFTTRSISGRV